MVLDENQDSPMYQRYIVSLCSEDGTTLVVVVLQMMSKMLMVKAITNIVIYTDTHVNLTLLPNVLLKTAQMLLEALFSLSV